MRRIFSCLFAVILLVCAPAFAGRAAEVSEVEALIGSMPADWPQGPEISSPSAIVMDADSGAILYAKEATQRHYPASTTKIMTALLAIENGNLSDIVRFSSTAVNSLPAGSSHIGMRVGEELTVQDCLYGLLLPSANEVANALAEYVSGTTEAFVEEMNARAAEIGTVQTRYTNPTGLHDDNHYTCAYDLAIIMRECVQNPTFCAIDGAPAYVIPATNLTAETRPVGSTHSMLREGSEYYDARVIGGKTGWTVESGRNLITYAYDGGMHVVVVTLGAEAPNQYVDTEKLLDFAFSSFKSVSAADPDASYGGGSAANLLHLPRTELQLFALDEESRVTLPAGVSFSDLTAEAAAREDGGNVVQYSWQGYPVGSAVLQQQAAASAVEQESLLPEIRPLYRLNLWYVVAGAAVAALLVLFLWRFRRRRRGGISFRKRKR